MYCGQVVGYHSWIFHFSLTRWSSFRFVSSSRLKIKSYIIPSCNNSYHNEMNMFCLSVTWQCIMVGTAGLEEGWASKLSLFLTFKTTPCERKRKRSESGSQKWKSEKNLNLSFQREKDKEIEIDRERQRKRKRDWEKESLFNVDSGNYFHLATQASRVSMEDQRR